MFDEAQLRDWFAAKALPRFISHDRNRRPVSNPEEAATQAYAYADAMMLARSAAPPAPSVADKRTLSDEQIAKAWFGDEYGPGHTRAPGYVYTFLEALDAPSVADAAGVSLPENIDWTRVMTLAEKHGDGWSNEKGWSFHCDDDLFNFAGELAKESGK